MALGTKGRPALSDEQLAQLLELIEDVDSVEYKLTVPENERFSSIAVLGIDPLDAQIRQIYFFDTPNLDLEDSGIILRTRRLQGEPDDLVVKLRPVVPDDLPDELRDLEDFKVEVDSMP